MPFLGSKQALRFKGKKLESFLTHFERMAKRAGIKEQELPFGVLNYCSTSEMRLYCADKGNDRVTVVGLRQFSDKMRREKKVRTRRAVNKYAIAFGKKMGDLVPRALMSESERDVLFFSTENLDYDPESEEEESDSSDDDEGSRRKGKKKKARVYTLDPTAVALESVTHLSEQIRWLSLAIEQGRVSRKVAGPIGDVRCPQTLGLLRDGVVKFAPDRGQLVRAHGSPLLQAKGIIHSTLLT
ncbi:hypothetical protein POSPLADRAFT_1050433 [Postia placenta MAD-698-R-SB12]|uniref:Uncharacterized protein n=1 Tax=Postia placenta MAD-698-R-SB12 TaxID=670580 RepID=A0A1X6MK27_9APHY|nr:hypothetical protein POSPLADRAFT_1050433 [Postia placenta MAD-698-R-SB12]OSX56734.1 hypothetical protein POSPLADRAFT_1050433 [Postia placenta MAD-698-R-SB12]